MENPVEPVSDNSYFACLDGVMDKSRASKIKYLLRLGKNNIVFGDQFLQMQIYKHDVFSYKLGFIVLVDMGGLCSVHFIMSRLFCCDFH